MNDAIRYMYPMVLWSVEVIQLTTMRPLDLRYYGEPRGCPVGGLSSYVATSLALTCVSVRFGLRSYSAPSRPVFPSWRSWYVRLELRLGDNLDAEEHFGVVLAAELGALAVVGALRWWGSNQM